VEWNCLALNISSSNHSRCRLLDLGYFARQFGTTLCIAVHVPEKPDDSGDRDVD
jgi:hypothetical protein